MFTISQEIRDTLTVTTGYDGTGDKHLFVHCISLGQCLLEALLSFMGGGGGGLATPLKKIAGSSRTTGHPLQSLLISPCSMAFNYTHRSSSIGLHCHTVV